MYHSFTINTIQKQEHYTTFCNTEVTRKTAIATSSKNNALTHGGMIMRMTNNS